MTDTNAAPSGETAPVADSVALTPEENKYFESRGEADPAPKQAEQPPKAEEPKPDKVEKVVPLQALQEERRQRQDLAKRLRDMELENARFQERFKLAEKVEPAPKPGEDPFAYLEKVIPGEIEGVKKKLEEFERRDKVQAAKTHLVGAYRSDVERFKADNPTFDEAYKFVVDGYVAEARAMGSANPQRAAQEHELQLVVAAIKRGTSPAKAIYEVAKARGFAEKPKEDKTAKLDTIEKGQAANRSLTATGGSSGGEAMTAEQLLKMPMDEFEKWCNSHPAQARRLMGSER